MVNVRFPDPVFQTKTVDGRKFIFDNLRKKWLVLTEEEWVRQNFIQYLIQELKYPAALIAVEKAIAVFDLTKRFDILIYNSHHQPWMLVECKEEKIALNESVLHQALRYNLSAPVKYIILTSGRNTIGWKRENGTMTEVSAMPQWEGE